MEIYVNNSPKLEVRLAKDGGKTLVGYAAVFNQKTNIGGFDEIISPNAFDESLNDKNLDCVALFDHTGQILGRTSSGTLKLSKDDYGLKYEIDLPNTGHANDVLELVKRGDVSKSSFGFRLGQDGDEWNYNVKPPLRTLTNIALHDVSPVTSPAYANTSVMARSKSFEQVESDKNLIDKYSKLVEQRLREIREVKPKKYNLS